MLALRPRLNLDTAWRGPFTERWPVPSPREWRVSAPQGVTHVEPAPLAMLAAWADEVRDRGGVVHVDSNVTTPYAYRTGLLSALLGSEVPSISLKHHAPPRRVHTQDDKGKAFTDLDADIDIESLGQRAAFSKTLSEAFNNVFEHSSSKRGCVVAGSRFDRSGRVTLAVADRGMGVAAHIRKLHGQLTDEQALLRATEPGVTGTARPGASGSRASYTATNAGLGLFVMRQIAGDSGRFVLISGSHYVASTGSDDLEAEAAEAPWQGTTVCVSYAAQGSDDAVDAVATALSVGIKPNRKTEPFSFQPLSPDNAVRVVMQPTYRGLIEDKRQANHAREHVLLPAIAAGIPVEINLERGQIIAHSCAHALLFEVVRRAGNEARGLVHVRAKTRQIKDVVRLIGHHALQVMEQGS